MTPAEYARSQGWRVGDLLWSDLFGTVGELRATGESSGLLFLYYEALGCGYWHNERLYKLGKLRRIGRVLRPEGR